MGTTRIDNTARHDVVAERLVLGKMGRRVNINHDLKKGEHLYCVTTTTVPMLAVEIKNKKDLANMRAEYVELSLFAVPERQHRATLKAQQKALRKRRSQTVLVQLH